MNTSNFNKIFTQRISPFSAIIFVLLLLPFSHLNAQTGNTTLGTAAGAKITTGDNNTFIGDSTGYDVTSGSNLTFLGKNAGFNSTSSTDNIFIGHLAGFSNTTKSNNIFIGKAAGYTNINGENNLFIGLNAGYFSNADDNTFIGVNSGANNTSGSNNTFAGEQAGLSNTAGRDNTFVGEDAGYSNTTAHYNTFIGKSSGRLNTTGYRNTAVGNEAGYDFSTGHHNVAVGDSSGIDNGAGFYNTFLGAGAAPRNEHADYGTFVGAYAGWNNNSNNNLSNANRNSYVGFKCGYLNREGQDNVGMGAFANFNTVNRSRCTFIGAAAQANNNDVIVIGYNALANKQFGLAIGNQSNIAGIGIGIGHNSIMDNGSVGSVIIGNTTYATAEADSSVAIGSFSAVNDQFSIAIGSKSTVNSGAFNSIAIGYNASVSDSNSVVIGNPSTEDIGGAVNWTALSDGRFKSNVKENVPGLSFITRLRPVTYNFDEDAIYDFQGIRSPSSQNGSISSKNSTSYSGFIAQEVEAEARALDYEFSGVKIPENPETESYGLRYAEFVVPLVQSVQELNKIIEQQQQRIEQLENENYEMKAAYEYQQTEIDQIKVILGMNSDLASKK